MSRKMKKTAMMAHSVASCLMLLYKIAFRFVRLRPFALYPSL